MKTKNFKKKSLNIIEKVDWEKVKGLIPAVIQSAVDREVLMLGYMDREALEKTLEEDIVCFYSRTKQRLWRKGETSGNYLKVCSISLDCDRDTLLVEVEPTGPVCHTGDPGCFPSSFTQKLEAIIERRKKEKLPNSYVHRLMEKGAMRIAQKIGEEGVEVALASSQGDKERIVEETADLYFHLLVNLNYHNLSFKDVEQVLNKRHREKNDGIYQKILRSDCDSSSQ